MSTMTGLLVDCPQCRGVGRYALTTGFGARYRVTMTSCVHCGGRGVVEEPEDNEET